MRPIRRLEDHCRSLGAVSKEETPKTQPACLKRLTACNPLPRQIRPNGCATQLAFPNAILSSRPTSFGQAGNRRRADAKRRPFGNCGEKTAKLSERLATAASASRSGLAGRSRASRFGRASRFASRGRASRLAGRGRASRCRLGTTTALLVVMEQTVALVTATAFLFTFAARAAMAAVAGDRGAVVAAHQSNANHREEDRNTKSQNTIHPRTLPKKRTGTVRTESIIAATLGIPNAVTAATKGLSPIPCLRFLSHSARL